VAPAVGGVAVPVALAVGVVAVLELLLLCITRVMSRKATPTPSTPRMTI
jgi:hypothetical protein